MQFLMMSRVTHLSVSVTAVCMMMMNWRCCNVMRVWYPWVYEWNGCHTHRQMRNSTHHYYLGQSTQLFRYKMKNASGRTCDSEPEYNSGKDVSIKAQFGSCSSDSCSDRNPSSSSLECPECVQRCDNYVVDSNHSSQYFLHNFPEFSSRFSFWQVKHSQISLWQDNSEIDELKSVHNWSGAPPQNTLES
jgi:hypothetical protein